MVAFSHVHFLYVHLGIIALLRTLAIEGHGTVLLPLYWDIHTAVLHLVIGRWPLSNDKVLIRGSIPLVALA